MNDETDITIRAFTANDIDPALAFWTSIEGLGLAESDSRAGIEAFLMRNPGFSAIAPMPDTGIVGAVPCGHNGRAAYLYHLPVSRRHRKRGVATSLLNFCFARLAEAQIPRCNIFVYAANDTGNAFWRRSGWVDPADWKVMQKRIDATSPPTR